MTEQRRQELEDVVVRVVRARYPGVDFPAIRVWPELDHDGDPRLRVEIHFRPEDEALRCKIGLGVPLIDEMWTELAAIGETRFPCPGSCAPVMSDTDGLDSADLLAAARLLLEGAPGPTRQMPTPGGR